VIACFGQKPKPRTSEEKNATRRCRIWCSEDYKTTGGNYPATTDAKQQRRPQVLGNDKTGNLGTSSRTKSLRLLLYLPHHHFRTRITLPRGRGTTMSRSWTTASSPILPSRRLPLCGSYPATQFSGYSRMSRVSSRWVIRIHVVNGNE